MCTHIHHDACASEIRFFYIAHTFAAIRYTFIFVQMNHYHFYVYVVIGNLYENIVQNLTEWKDLQ